MTVEDPVRLTTVVKCAGCAAKVSIGALAHVLEDLPTFHDPRVLVGHDLADDAGVTKINDDLAIVQTIDFFPPIVDDPYTYGSIAATNAISDVYAMGGTPLSAMNVVIYPTKTLPMDILEKILHGGLDKASEAGISVVGGHTVEGDEPTYGLAVTGTIHPDRIIRASTAQAGDVLVLTKPIGTGVITTAAKNGVAAPVHVREAVRWMTRLTRSASLAMVETGVSAATDVTGFGLLGHLAEVARASGLAAEINHRAVPLIDGAWLYSEQGMIPGGGRSNEAYVADDVTWAADIAEPWRHLLADPQTSGGLLIAIPEPREPELRRRLVEAGDIAATVGRLREGVPGAIRIS
jgi:selenide,water dikinase